MFSSYNIEKYNFDGILKDTRIFNIDFDLSIYNNFLYSEKVSDNFMLDTFALEKYAGHFLGKNKSGFFEKSIVPPGINF